MTEQISTRYGSEIVTGLIETIVSNREYLSEIDGAIGDGDHGINMSKGFAMCGDAIRGRELTLAQAFDAVSDALMEGIGGSMGRCTAACSWAWRRASVSAACWISRHFWRCCTAD